MAYNGKVFAMAGYSLNVQPGQMLLKKFFLKITFAA
jgi:hypothetical protein